MDENVIDVNEIIEVIEPTPKGAKLAAREKFIYLIIGCLIAALLYFKCMFNPNCNSIVVAYFSIVSLACLSTYGVPVERIGNGILK